MAGDFYVDNDFDDMVFNIAAENPVPADLMGDRRLGCEIIHQWWRDLHNEADQVEHGKCLAWLNTPHCVKICELAGITLQTLRKALRMYKQGKL